MIFLKILMLLLLFVAFPLLIGVPSCVLFGIYTQRPIHKMLFSYAFGFITLLCEMQLIAVPLILSWKSLTSFVLLFCVFTGLLILVLSLFAKRKLLLNGERQRAYSGFKRILQNALHSFRSLSHLSRIAIICTLAVFLLIVFQYVFRMHVDDDDARYMVNATDAFLTDKMYQYYWGTGNFIDNRYLLMTERRDLISPWVMTFALYGRLTGIHPTILAHVVFPPFLILTGAFEWVLASDALFHGNRDKECGFLFLVSITYLTFGGNTHTQAAVTLVRVWQGKAAFAAMIIPMLFYIYLALSDETAHRIKYYLMFMITVTAGCYLSGAGIAGSGMIAGGFGLWDILVKKKWKELPLLVVSCLPALIYALMYKAISG